VVERISGTLKSEFLLKIKNLKLGVMREGVEI
jgi:hypothetical protein